MNSKTTPFFSKSCTHLGRHTHSMFGWEAVGFGFYPFITIIVLAKRTEATEFFEVWTISKKGDFTLWIQNLDLDQA